MNPKLKKIIDEIDKVLKTLNTPRSKYLERDIFLNKLQSEIEVLRDSYSLTKTQ